MKILTVCMHRLFKKHDNDCKNYGLNANNKIMMI